MANFSVNERINLAYKLVFGIQGTSNTDDALGRNWYEELYPWTPLLESEDVFIENVPEAAAGQGSTVAAANPTIIQEVDIKLTKKTGYNGRVWAAHSTYNDEDSALLDKFLLPQKFGQGYTARFYQDDGAGNKGSEFLTTEGAWVFAYGMGFLLLADNYTTSDLSWTEPIHLVGFRYIGQTVANIAGSAITLDGAYSNGNSIDIDSGPVTLDATPDVNAYAPLRMIDLASAPTSDLTAGDVAIVNGEMYAYDATRLKWLSVNRNIINFSHKWADSRYLIYSDNFATRYLGFLVHKDSCITSIIAKCDQGNLNKTFYIRRNSALSNIGSFTLSAGQYSDNSININLNQGDVLQVFASNAGEAAQHLSVQFEIATRV